MARKSNRVLVSPEGLELLTAAKARLGTSFAAITERVGAESSFDVPATVFAAASVVGLAQG